MRFSPSDFVQRIPTLVFKPQVTDKLYSLFAQDELGVVKDRLWVTVYPILLLPMFVRVFKSVAIHFRDYLIAIGPTLLNTALMGVVVLAIQAFLPVALSLPARFAIEVGGGVTAFILAALITQRRRLSVLVDFAKGMRS